MKGYNRPELNHTSLNYAMRRQSANPPPPLSDAKDANAANDTKAATRSDWATLHTLLPYLWVYKWRVLAALGCLIGAKMANVGVPLVLKRLIDALAVNPSDPQALLLLPVGVLLAYGALRLSATVFTELREFLFARVTQRAVRTIALQVFRHLHALSLRFHLNRQTGVKTFYLIRKFGGKAKRYVIGKYPAVDIEVARRVAQDFNGKLAQGTDPTADDKNGMTFESLFDKFMNEYSYRRNITAQQNVEHYNRYLATDRAENLFSLLHQPKSTPKCQVIGNL